MLTLGKRYSLSVVDKTSIFEKFLNGFSDLSQVVNLIFKVLIAGNNVMNMNIKYNLLSNGILD